MAQSSRWVLPAADPDAAERLASALHIGTLAARVLVERGYVEPASAREFLEPGLDGLYDAFTLRDMDRAAKRLAQAVRAREKVLIYGDYDVDGTTSVVLLMKAIEMAGGQATWRIPHRLKEGYGIRPEAVEIAAAEHISLIVSVDTGIRAGDVVRRASEAGIDVIVTDHHLPEAELPPALAVLNPNRADCGYPNKNLCGAGVALKLAQALFAEIGWTPDRVRRVTESFLKIAALATIADVVPLTGENRVIVKYGLSGLGDVRNPGLKALLEVAGFEGAKTPSSRQVAFQIAPRINAAGRMDSARAVIELFLTSDPARARELAAQLHQWNAERQQAEQEIRQDCESRPFDGTDRALVYYDAGWHRGVLGIVASRLVERLHRPVFVLGLSEENGLAQGSGRSIQGFHLLEALESMPGLFERFGGHRYAAGVTLPAARVPEFRERFNAYAAARLNPDDLVPTLNVDAVVRLTEVGESSAEDVFKLAPFGYGNPQPVFAAMNVEVAGPPVVMKEKHLRLAVKQDGRSVVLKAWNFAPRKDEFGPGTRLDVAFTLEEDAYSASRGYAGWCAVLREARAASQAREAAAS
jgi:single-stranded-DNA-specific exonuclease